MLESCAVLTSPEREFSKVYRASDAARQLNDAENATALKFVRASFEAALVCRGETAKAGEAATDAAIRKTDAR